MSQQARRSLDPIGFGVHLWSVRLPHWLDPWAPGWADSFADGAWMFRWRAVAAIAPVAAFVVGFLATRLWPHADVFSDSLPFMGLLIVGSFLSGPVGVMLLVGYAAAALVGKSQISYYDYRADIRGWSAAETFVRWGAGQLVAFLLLAVLVRLPLIARQLTEELASRILVFRWPLSLPVFAATSGLLVYLWAQAVAVLIRPVFTWAERTPEVTDIWPVQLDWGWLVAAALVAATVRLVLEAVAQATSSNSLESELREQRAEEAGRRGEAWRRFPRFVPAVVTAVVVTFVLSGLYDGWLEAVGVAIVVALLSGWAGGLLGELPRPFTGAINRVPALIRLGVGLFLGYELSAALIGRPGGSFRPVVIGTLLTIALLYLLFPRERLGSVPRGDASPQNAASAIPRVLGLFLVLYFFGPAAQALADNCSDSPADCWETGAAAAAAAAGAGVLAGAIGLASGLSLPFPRGAPPQKAPASPDPDPEPAPFFSPGSSLWDRLWNAARHPRALDQRVTDHEAWERRHPKPRHGPPEPPPADSGNAGAPG